MSQRTVLKIRCDRCGHVEEVEYHSQSLDPSAIGPRPAPPRGWGMIGDGLGRKDLCPACTDDYALFMRRPPDKRHEYHVEAFVDMTEPPALDITTKEGLCLRLVLPVELQSKIHGVHDD